MAFLKSKTLFFTTSPRTPFKMIPEIKILENKFLNKKWDSKTQQLYIDELVKDDNFEGKGSFKDKAFSARDRINRAPKSLGFVDIKPVIKITNPGSLLMSGVRSDEVLLRQLLKFQLPSPYHKETEKLNGVFYVKPYLEILRLIYTLEKLSFDELMIYGMQLTHYNKFEFICSEIEKFRKKAEEFHGSYNQFVGVTLEEEILKIYSDEITTGETATRESNDKSINKFVKTKSSNLRDYTDACIRYLRSSGMITISFRGRHISIMPDKVKDVEYVLNTIDRNPCYVDDENSYKRYLFDSNIPELYSDNAANLVESIMKISTFKRGQISSKGVNELKDIRDTIIYQNKEKIIKGQVERLKSYALYSEVIDTYNEIIADQLYDLPLMLEWNTWRAMTMIDGGEIKGNFKIDDAGQPMSTASGNMADIVCDYVDFGLTVEVTMQTGQRQYEMEGEPVARHLAKYKQLINKDAYCLFIAPTINPATIAHFYALHKMDISYYGGKSVILPVPLDIFMKMIENTYCSKNMIRAISIKNIFEQSSKIANDSADELEWFNTMMQELEQWPA